MRLAGRDVWLLRFALLFLLFAVVWLTLSLRKQLASPVEEAPVEDAQPARKYVKGGPGPWGHLEYVRINIERPDELTHVPAAVPQPARWFFENMAVSQVDEFLQGLNWEEARRVRLLDPQRVQTTTNGVIVEPGDDLIMELAPTDRERIYALLARSARNQAQQFPYAYHAASLDAVFQQSGLLPRTVSLVTRMFYRRGNSACFSDMDTVIRQLGSDPGEVRRLVKTMSRQTTLLVRLRIEPDTDVNTLIQYWGKGGRAKDIGPLLGSLTKIKGGASLDIAHLLPPLARMNLYTYPFPSGNTTNPAPNCLWTAFNFFHEEPDDRFFDYAYVDSVIARDYETIGAAPAYGDIIYLATPEAGILHTAVYIADDIVYTKNGGHYTQPWVLMRIDDMIASYPSTEALRVGVLRRKST
ncbi:MAG: hypothetical protein AB1705_24220 [Verrucomicrobiota bacterium]